MEQRWPGEAGKGEEMCSLPQTPKKNVVLLKAQICDLFQTFNLQNYKIVNVDCFKPLSLWSFVTTINQ